MPLADFFSVLLKAMAVASRSGLVEGRFVLTQIFEGRRVRRAVVFHY